MPLTTIEHTLDAAIAARAECCPPPGCVCVAVNALDEPPAAVSVQIEDLPELLLSPEYSAPLDVCPAQWRAAFLADWRDAKDQGRPDLLAGLARRAISFSLGRPADGAPLRRALAAEMRRNGRAVVSIHVSASAIGTAVGPGRIDLAAAVAARPAGGAPAFFVLGTPSDEKLN